MVSSAILTCCFPCPLPSTKTALKTTFPATAAAQTATQRPLQGAEQAWRSAEAPSPENSAGLTNGTLRLHSQARLHLTRVFAKTLSIVHQSKINQRQGFNTMAAWRSTIGWGWISWSKTVMEKWGWKDVHRCLWKAKAYSRESRRPHMCRAVCRHSEGRRSCSSLTSDQSSGSTQTGAER